MKKIYTVLSVIALAVLAVGCAKEIDNPDAVREELVTIDQATGESIITVKLSVPDCPDTKTTLGAQDGNSYPVLWSAGDVITLNGTAATEFTPASGNATATAKFKVTNLAAPYNFLYNGSGTNQVSFPSTQNYVADGFDPAAMPMYASVMDLTAGVAFSHVGALLKFSFTGEKKIDTINLSAADNNASLSGNFTIGATAGLLNGTLTPAAGGAGLTYSFGGHKQLSETHFIFYIAIPAGTYEGGITLDVIDNDSGHMTVKVMDSDETKTIAAGKVREFDNVTYIPNKEVNLKQIYNDATFLEFVTAVAGGQKTLNARLTQSAATLSLSAATVSAFNSIEDYKGTFDGNGKTISGLDKPMFATLKGVVKNLTLNSTINETAADEYHWGMFAKQIIPSSEVDDLPGLQNCTAEGSITWTPASAIGSYMTLGGLVGNNRGGTITGCTNNAAVTFADGGVTHTNQPSVGGVVGRTQKGGEGISYQGDISNCTNNGTVTVAAQFSQGAYIGGVLGYQVEKAETMSGCTNHGLVKVASTFSTSGALHLAGVAGMAKGAVENCTNASDGVVTSEACSVSSYLCQGGVVGRLNGTATYSTLTNAGTLNVAALGGSTARLIGGVVGRCNEGATLDGVTNSGNINYTAEDTHDTYIGGVVAHNDKTGIILQNCSSTGGTLTVSNASHSGALYVGGVVGYSTKDVTSCSNAMTIATSGSMTQGSNSYLCFGGVIGYLTGAVTATNCTNSGAINYGQTVTNDGQTYVGGVAGALTGAEISGGGNSGTLTFSGQNTAKTPSIGGVVGRVFSNTTGSGYALSNNVTNSGAIVVNSTVSSSQYMYLGGLVGQHLAGNIYGTNDAPITVTEIHEAMMALGGIVGYLAGGTVSNGTNTANGDIALNGFISGYHSYTGGIVGIASSGSSIAAGGGTVTGASNAGDITVGSGCTIPRNNYVGGVIAYAGNTVSGASNTGNIVNNYSQGSSSNATSYHFQIAGVAARSVAALSSCYNTGNVTNNGTTYKSEINVAGVVAWSEGSLTSCSNGTASLAGGTISNTAKSGTNTLKDLQVAGVVANNRGQTLTGCFNKGEINNSGSGAQASVGGVAAWSNSGSSYSDCYNNGNVTNTANSGNTSTGVITVGGIAGYAGTSTFSKCINRGAITNSGTAGKDDTYCRVGGLVGQSVGSDLSASGDNKNINYGNVSDTSASNDSAFAGVVAYAEGDVSDFSNCRNEGTVTIGGSKTYIFTGGIAGAFANSSVLDNTYNSGAITASGATMSKSGYLRCGGIIGGWFNVACVSQTITGCTNTGSITLQPDNFGGEAGSNDSFVGGIAGGGRNDDGECGKALVNCINSGSITMGSSGSTNSGKLFHRYCVGGIIGFTNVNPTGSKCIANIRFRSTTGTNRVGGIAGEMMIESIHDVTYKGTVNSNGASGTNYTGGLVGNVGTGEITFNNCTVSGTMRGPNSTTTPAGIFCSNKGSGTGPTINITNCKVGSNTRLQAAASGYYITITSASDITASNVFGHNGSNRNCTAGTNSGNSVVDPDTITL